jgi:hypothetical protein
VRKHGPCFMNLPDLLRSQWRTRDIAISVSNALQEHIVALRVVVQPTQGGKARQAIYSGFLYEFDGAVAWVTAGHCLRDLTRAHRDGSLRVLSQEFVDTMVENESGAVPLGASPLPFVHFDKRGIDIGIVPVRYGFAAPLIKGRTGRVFNSRSVQMMPTPTGAYVMGFPDTWVQLQDVAHTSGKRHASADMYLAAFPVEIVPDQGKPAPHGSFWGHGDTYLYGRYLPYADEQGRTPTSLGGMSGGLLIEFSTTNTSHIDIRLAGIMSAELETTAYIKATRASLLAAFCDAIAKAVASDRVGASDIDRSTGIP